MTGELYLSGLVAAVSLLFVNTYPDPTLQEQGSDDAWFVARVRPAKGVVVVVHGLNNKPEIMDPLIEALNTRGLHARRVALAGHGSAMGNHSGNLDQLWLQDISSAYHECAERYPDLPVFLLGYSLGALTAVRFLDENPGAFERMVLYAPAIRLRWRTRLLRPLRPLARFRLSLPSLAPKEQRVRDWTPLAAYAAMFRLSDAVQKIDHRARIGATPTRVLLSRRDELVSYRGLERWIEENELHRWQLFAADVPTQAKNKHLLVVPSAVGTDAWKQVTDQLELFSASSP